MSELLCPICDKNVQSVNVTPDCQHTTKEIFDYARTLRKQLDEWKEAHDNLARQLSVTNDSLEIAVEALRQIPHTCYHHPALACAGCIAQEALKRLEA